jgi:peptidoglycan/LPS O-acetylase OafA/YrhL
MIDQQRIESFLLYDSKRIGALDGVRSAAIILVVLRHCFDRPLHDITLHPFLQYIMGFGWIGVDLFFVLSGFLIGGMIYDRLRNDSFSFSSFYISRSMRILPAAFFVLLIVGRASIGLNIQTLYNFIFVINYTGGAFVPHYWSLNVEEHFYIVFSILFVFYYKFIVRKDRSLQYILYVLLCGILVLWIARFYFTCIPSSYHLLADRVYKVSHWQIDYFLLGVLGAVLYKNNIIPQSRLLGYTLILIPVGYLILSVTSASYCHNTMENQLPSLYGFLGPLFSLWCFLFVMTAATQKNIATKFLSWSIWRYIAVLSYSIYLVHLSCIGILNRFSFFIKTYFVGYPNIRAFITVFIAFTFSALCALIVFTLIERPFLLMRSYILKKRALSYSSQLKLLVTQKNSDQR